MCQVFAILEIELRSSILPTPPYGHPCLEKVLHLRRKSLREGFANEREVCLVLTHTNGSGASTGRFPPSCVRQERKPPVRCVADALSCGGNLRNAHRSSRLCASATFLFGGFPRKKNVKTRQGKAQDRTFRSLEGN
jgi:hypothetical protein